MNYRCIYILESIRNELSRIMTICTDEDEECWRYLLTKLNREIEENIRTMLRVLS